MANVIEFTIKGVDGFSRTTGKFARSMTNAGKTVLKFGSIAAAALGAAAIPILNVSRSFEKMEASLATVTGSTDKAAKAMAGIRKFAKDTPFQVSEITQSFIKLTALGLEPSEEALRSYGNTASAMGKSLDQFIEAVADATTNEFERLKEFGIKARQEGDNVSFTFQGVTTTIKKNSEDISGYLQSIGNVQFAGAMEVQMATLDGRISNLKDTVDNFFDTIGKAGLLDLAKNAVTALSEKIKDMSGTVIRVSAIVGIAFNNIRKKISESVGGGTAFKDMFNVAVQVFKTLVEQAATLALGIAQVLVSSFEIIFKTFFILGKNAFKRTWDLLVNSTDAVIAAVGGAFVLLWDGVTESAQFAWDNIQAVFTGGEFRSLGDLLFKDIPAKTAETRKNLASITDDIEFTSPGIQETLDEIVAGTQSTRDKIAGQFDGVLNIITSNISNNVSAIADFMGITEEEVSAKIASMSELINGVQGELAQASKDTAEVVKTVWEEVGLKIDEFADKQMTTTIETAEIMFNTMQSLIAKTSDAVASAIVEGKNLGKALQAVFKSVAKAVISDLIRMGIQRLITGKLFAVTNAKQAIGQAAPLPPLAAAGGMASMAAAPFPLNLTAPAFAATMFAQTTGFTAAVATAAAAGQFHDGGVVPRDGTFNLQGGEVVIPNNPNQDVIDALGDLTGGGGKTITIGSIHILENATSFDALMQMSDTEIKDLVEDKFIDALSALDEEGIRSVNQERNI